MSLLKISRFSYLKISLKEQELAMEDQEGNLEEALSPALKKKASDVLSDIFRDKKISKVKKKILLYSYDYVSMPLTVSSISAFFQQREE